MTQPFWNRCHEWERRFRPLLLVAALLAGAWLLPLARKFQVPLPQCGMKKVLGIPCPFCGSTRMLAALGRLEWTEALRWNPLTFFATWLTAFWAILWLGATVRKTSLPSPWWEHISWKFLVPLALLNWAYLLRAGY